MMILLASITISVHPKAVSKMPMANLTLQLAEDGLTANTDSCSVKLRVSYVRKEGSINVKK
jgi:hypothetical protein